MHRALGLSCLLASSVVLASSPPPPLAATLEQPVTLVLGGAATVGKFIVIYQRVVNDSRCPENARCITAGTVNVLGCEFECAYRPHHVDQVAWRVTSLHVLSREPQNIPYLPGLPA